MKENNLQENLDTQSQELVEEVISEEITIEKKPKEDNKKAKKPAKKENTSVKESANFKCEQFFGKNWKYIAFFLGFTLLFMAYQISGLSSSMQELEKVVNENNGKVVLTTTDGRAIKVAKEQLKAEYIKQFAISTIVNNFVISRAQLTENFQKASFKTPSEVLKTVASLRIIATDFIGADNKQAMGELTAYIQWLISAVAKDQLPEFISIRDYTIDKYEYSGNQFSAEVSIKVVAQSYILSQDKYITQNGLVKITTKGNFDLSRSTDINPYGLRFESIRINTVTKPKVQ